MIALKYVNQRVMHGVLLKANDERSIFIGPDKSYLEDPTVMESQKWYGWLVVNPFDLVTSFFVLNNVESKGRE